MNIHDRIIYPKNSLDITRNNFEKNFLTSVHKAINRAECPVKEKHIRSILMGTFYVKSGRIFWIYAQSLDLEANPIICWKFCHVLHKVLRDGHPKAIQDSFTYRSTLVDLSKMWGFLKHGYGQLIERYCLLLVNKIDFHIRNPQFPGNLNITDNELDSIQGNDSNNIFFQLCCEIYDYMDEILHLQTNVFDTLNMSLSSSMTSAGQCRLAPLIMCIQDSSQLYDFTVKILFKLHLALPHSTLEGHRERFLQQFKSLKYFYYRSNLLHYFKPLITIPKLPDEPPNFSVHSNLNSHVTPVVIIPEPEEPIESEANLLDLTFDDNDSSKADDVSLWSFQDDKTITHEQSIIEEKQRLIDKLSNRIGELEIELAQTKDADEKKIEELKRSIVESECATAQRMEKEIESLKIELEKQKTNVSSEQALKEKFNKAKEFYNKFRLEHIELLKNKVECDKKLIAAQTTIEQLKNEQELFQKQLEEYSNKNLQSESLVENNENLKKELSNVDNELKTKLIELEELKNGKGILENKLSLISGQFEEIKKVLMEEKLDHSRQIVENNKIFISTLINESLKISKRIIDEEMELGLLSVNCNPQYFCSQIQILIAKFADFERTISTESYSLDLFMMAFHYYYQLFYMINCSKTFVKTIANIELSQELYAKCVDLVNLNLDLDQFISNNFKNHNNSIEKIKELLQEIYALTKNIIPEFVSNKNLDLETLLNKEMEHMDNAIQDAVSKIEHMINTSNTQQSGIKLEVNGKILNACTGLMQTIKQLIVNAKHLQLEIASKQKGNFSMKEFYQRNHRWTEGLISAAKTVAADANLLVETADKIISGCGKFEELIAASQEIAASCAQLVVASRVKADSSSQNLANLSKSSKSVLHETGNIIAITKHCGKLIEENVENDFSKLSLHQAKRLEMECQVKILELENLVEKERVRLSSIRRAHYHLAESLSYDGNGTIK